jgi:hypothetical protein
MKYGGEWQKVAEKLNCPGIRGEFRDGAFISMGTVRFATAAVASPQTLRYSLRRVSPLTLRSWRGE